MSRLILVFWLLERILIGIVTFLMIIISLQLAEIFLSFLVLFYSDYVDLYYRSTIFLVSITTLAWTKILFIWSKSAWIRLEKLFITVVIKTKKRRLLNLNIFMKIISPKGLMTPNILITHIFNKRHRLSNLFNLDINYFLTYFFLFI